MDNPLVQGNTLQLENEDAQAPIYKPLEYPDPEIVLKLPKLKKQCVHQTVSESDLKNILYKKQAKLRKKHLDKFFIRSLNIRESALRKIKNTEYKDDKIYISKHFAVNVVSVQDEKLQYEKFRVLEDQKLVQEELDELISIYKEKYQVEPKLDIRRESDLNLQKQVLYLQNLQEQKLRLQKRLEISDELMRELMEGNLTSSIAASTYSKNKRNEKSLDKKSRMQAQPNSSRKAVLQKQISYFNLDTQQQQQQQQQEAQQEEMDAEKKKAQKYEQSLLEQQERAQQTQQAISEQIKKIYGSEHMNIVQIKQHIDCITEKKQQAKKLKKQKKLKKSQTEMKIPNQWDTPNQDQRQLVQDDKGDFQFDFQIEQQQREKENKLNSSLPQILNNNIINSNQSKTASNRNSSIISMENQSNLNSQFGSSQPQLPRESQGEMDSLISIVNQSGIQNPSQIGSRKQSQASMVRSSFMTKSGQADQQQQKKMVKIQENGKIGEFLDNSYTNQNDSLDLHQEEDAEESQQQQSEKELKVKKKKKKKKVKNIPNNLILEREDGIKDIIRNLELLKKHYQQDTFKNIENHSYDCLTEEYQISNKYVEDYIGKYLLLQTLIQENNVKTQQKLLQKQQDLTSARSYNNSYANSPEKKTNQSQENLENGDDEIDNMNYRVQYDTDISYEDDRIYTSEFYKYLKKFKTFKIKKYHDKEKELIEKAKKQLDECQDKTAFFEELLLYTNAQFIKQKAKNRYSTSSKSFEGNLDELQQTDSVQRVQHSENLPSQDRNLHKQTVNRASIDSSMSFSDMFGDFKKKKKKKRLNSQPTLKQLQKMQKKKNAKDFEVRNGIRTQMTVPEESKNNEKTGGIFQQIEKIGVECEKYSSQISNISKRVVKANNKTHTKYKKLEKTILNLN